MGWKRVFLGIVVTALGATWASGEGARLWTDPASGRPGEEVVVVIKGSWDVPVAAMSIAFAYRSSDLTYLGCDFSSGLGSQTGLTSINDELEENALFIIVRADPQLGDQFPSAREQEICRLFFRIRSRTAPGRVQASIVPRIKTRPWETVVVRKGETLRDVRIEPGWVTVEPPSGPLPPDLFTCAQELAAVVVSWENPVGYDWLVLRRNGELLAQLPGSATAYEDSDVPEGAYEYELTGWVGAESSVAVRCRITVTSPQADPVEDLSCTETENGVELNWTLPRLYTRIEVMRAGELLEVLDGTRTSYMDPVRPDGAVLYEVIGYVGDIPSPPVPCVVGAMWTGRLGSVTAPPGGGTVEIPVYLTHPGPIEGFTVGLRFDPSLCKPLGHTLRGTLLEGRQLLRWDVLGDDWARFSFQFCRPICWRMPPAIEACYVKLVFEVSPSVQAGTVIPLRLADGVGSPPLDCCMIPKGARTCIVFRKIDGEILVGEARVKPVVDLEVEPAKSSHLLVLRWRNGDYYDEIEVERNGEALARLEGGTEVFRDRVPGSGIYWYRVRGTRQGVPSPWKVVVYTFMPGIALFKRGEVNGDERVDLADAVAICWSLFDGLPLGCKDAADVNDDGTINLADPVYLLSYLFLGAAPPPPPGPYAAWYDPTPDGLDCSEGAPQR